LKVPTFKLAVELPMLQDLEHFLCLPGRK